MTNQLWWFGSGARDQIAVVTEAVELAAFCWGANSMGRRVDPHPKPIQLSPKVMGCRGIGRE